MKEKAAGKEKQIGEVNHVVGESKIKSIKDIELSQKKMQWK